MPKPAPGPGAEPTPGVSAETNERLRNSLAVYARAAAWEWSLPDGRIVGDEQFSALHGVPQQDAAQGIDAGRFFALIHPEDRTRIRLAVGSLMQGAQVFLKEYRLLLAEGVIRWVYARGVCHYDAEDRPTRFSGALVDITEQKRAEEHLRIAQTAGGIGTFEFVTGFATVAVSAQFCRLLGLQVARDLPVRTINAVVLAGDPPIIERAVEQSPPRASAQAEIRIRRPDDGQVRWLARRGEYLHGAGTTELRFSGVIYDITETKHTEEQLRNLGQTLEARVEERTRERDRAWKNSRDLQGVLDLGGVCQAANDAWTTILGWRPDEIVGRPAFDLIHPDDQQLTAAALSTASATTLASYENRYRHHDGGYRWISWVAASEQGLIYASGRHITAEREAAVTLAAMQEQLRHSQKMEAVGQLTGGLAHDFNNLLTSISGSLELLQSRLAEGRLAEVDRYVAAAQGASRRAAALTHRLLAFSRRQTLDPRPTDANRLINGMEEIIRRSIGPATELRIIGGAGLWSTLVDPNQLENALLNLSINARDAMPDGGLLTIRTENVWLDGPSAAEFDLSAGQYVVIRVSDTGTGMTEDVIARAFDPFFTTKPLGQGTGLGLSMIYGFVRQSGGQVRITSTVGQGTTMDIYLLRHHDLAPGAEPPPLPVVEAQQVRRGETVLIVDDEPSVRMLVAEVLQDLQYATVEAADGAAALRVLQSERRIDLLITDVGLPGGINGRQVADAGRGARPDLKVLFITGYAENATLGDGTLEPGMYVMTKPFTLEGLARRVEQLIMSNGAAMETGL